MTIAALDLGTTSVKALRVDRAGGAAARRSAALPLHTGSAGRATQPIEAAWAAVAGVLAEVAAAPGDPIEAVALSGAMHALAPIDAAGRAMDEAMTWADRRAADVADRLKAGLDPATLEAMYWRTGCPWSVLYHPARLRWLGGGRHAAATWASIKDAVVHRLTGVWATDVSLASATGLLDIHRRRWDAASLELASTEAEALPPLVEPEHIVGRVTPEAAGRTGLAVGTPVVCGASDGALANLGAGAGVGETVVTVGTSAAVRRLVVRPAFHPERATWCYIAPGGRWLAGAAMNSGGIAIQRLLDDAYAGEADPWATMEAEAGSVAAGAEGALVLPFVEGERDLVWPHRAGRRVVGFDEARHGRPHLARATLEGVCYAVATLWAVVHGADADDARVRPTTARLTGGIVRSKLWRQVLADVLGVALLPVEAADASALGAGAVGWAALGEEVDWAAARAWAGPTPPSPPPADGGWVAPNVEPRAAYRASYEKWVAACRERGWWLVERSNRYSERTF